MPLDRGVATIGQSSQHHDTILGFFDQGVSLHMLESFLSCVRRWIALKAVQVLSCVLVKSLGVWATLVPIYWADIIHSPATDFVMYLAVESSSADNLAEATMSRSPFRPVLHRAIPCMMNLYDSQPLVDHSQKTFTHYCKLFGKY